MIETAAPDASASALAAGAALDPAEFRAIAAILHEEARIRLPESKVTLVNSRLSRRLRDHGLGHFRDYVALVRRDAAERAVMVEALTTNHTHFFREQHHFDHLRDEGESIVCNAGYGHGFSVREVVRAVERISGQPLPVREEARRAGDPPAIIANSERLKSTLNWQPAHDDLDVIVRSAYAWEKRLNSA